MSNKPLTVAWISDFPVEWLPDLPEPLRALPRRHPATWAMALLSEFEKNPALKTHVILLRHRIKQGLSFEQNGTVFHVLKAPPWLRVSSAFWADTLLIKRICKRIKPDVVHAWGMEKGAGVIARRLGFPYVLSVQGLLGWYKEMQSLSRYDRFTEWLERRTLPRSPLVTGESTFVVEYLAKRYPGLQLQHVEHVPGWAFHHIQRRPQTDPVHFIFVGGIGFRKGTDLLFQALDLLRRDLAFKLTVVSSSHPQQVEALRATLPAELWARIQFKHDLLPQDVAGELETPTMLLMPTRADTGPLAVKEAVVAGVPVVGSDLGGIPDYVQPGQNGLLFPRGDLDAFVRAIRTAVQHPLFGKGKVEPAALASKRDHLSPARMAADFLAAYQRVIQH